MIGVCRISRIYGGFMYIDIALIIIGSLIAFVLLFSFAVFMLVFYTSARKPRIDGVYPVPKGKVYEPYYEKMREWARLSREIPHKNVSIKSYDGLTLRGRYYHFYDDAPIELMLHGYRGDSERDLSGGIFRAKRIGHNVLLVDQRACGESDGHVVTFGIRERYDCARWVDFIINEIDSNARIILTGVSMGAATVLMASGGELPSNVIGVLADCGYSSPKLIICDVLHKIHLPSAIFYPFIALGARIFGGFNLKEFSPIEAAARTNLPIIFFHGDVDAFVPCRMSIDNYNACASERKRLVVIKGAGHGLCYVANEEEYVKELKDFFDLVKETTNE